MADSHTPDENEEPSLCEGQVEFRNVRKKVHFRKSCKNSSFRSNISNSEENECIVNDNDPGEGECKKQNVEVIQQEAVEQGGQSCIRRLRIQGSGSMNRNQGDQNVVDEEDYNDETFVVDDNEKPENDKESKNVHPRFQNFQLKTFIGYESNNDKQEEYQDQVREWTGEEEEEDEEDTPQCLKDVRSYAESMNACERRISCRHLLETLNILQESPDDVEKLFKIIDRLSQDLEPHVLAELIENVVPIARFCYQKEQLHYLIAEHLVPLLLKFLMASDPQVRVNAQECLRLLRSQNLIDQEIVKRDICPALDEILNLNYSTRSSPEYCSRAITLMTKMAPVLGREATEEFLIPIIISLSTDPVLDVRRLCVVNFGEYCSAVSTEVTENVLLPSFIKLCRDEKWEVRKACAEVIMSVSCACQLETRKSKLAPICAALLSDSSRSVRMAAFETLGPFITTFAEPSITGLAYNQHGQLVLTNWDGFEFRTTPSDDEICRKYDEVGEMCAEFNKIGCSSLFELIDDSDNASSDNNDSISSCLSTSNVVTSSVTTSSDNDAGRDSGVELSSDSKSVVLSIDGNNSTIVSSQQYEQQINEDLNSLNEISNNISSGNLNNNFININNNDNSNTTDYDNEDSLQQYNTFLYWRDPLPIIDDLDIPSYDSSSDTNSNSSLTSPLSVSSPVSVGSNFYSQEFYSNMHSQFNNSDDSLNNFKLKQQQSKEDKQNVNSNFNSSISSTLLLNSSTAHNNVIVNKSDSSLDDKSSPTITVSKESKDETSQLIEMLVMQMSNHCLSSELNNDLTYKPIPCPPFSDTSAGRQDVGIFMGLGLVRKIPPEKPPRQNIVPQELIDHFVSLSDPIQGTCVVDNRFLVYQIAYSLPAVAQTLGKENWSLLKSVYERLAADKTWKVRRAVASSIHELAVIVGEDAATQDLIPVFNGIIKDVDEVRIGALKHFALFLKTLKPAGRNTFLPKLSEFLMTDCDMNWRFREELAEQLLQMVGLFSAADTYTHLMPLAILLLLDKVAAVRQVALSLVTELVRWISCDVRLLNSILVELAEQFAHSSRWNRRQTFALLCSQLVSQCVLPKEMFAVNVLPHLLDLSWDLVPNVRLAVARTLSADIAHHPYFSDPQSPHHDVVMQTLGRLQSDKDRDVQYLAFSKPRNLSSSNSDDGTAQEST